MNSGPAILTQQRPLLPIAAAVALCLTLIPQAAAVPPALSAREIMDKVALGRKLAGSEAVIRMSIGGDGGQTREREIAMASKLFDGGKTEKRIYRFLSPADVKGTGVLVFDYETEADDVWIFLPALRKTRRIISSQRAQSFMGSEFSYGDLNVPALDDYDYKLGKEELFDGESCWVIDVLPKSAEIASSEGYARKTYWVSQQTHAIRRGLYYDAKGGVLKELKTADVKLIDAKNQRYRPLRMEMTNKQNGRRSVFACEKIAFTPETSDEHFTTRYLERQ